MTCTQTTARHSRRAFQLRHAIAGLLMIGVIGSASAALADTASVQCVQNQLRALGFDAGPSDGIVGVRTFLAGEAYIRFMKANAELGWAQPALNDGNAAHWCEKVAEAHPRVSSHWNRLQREEAVLLSDPSAMFNLAYKLDTGEGAEQDEALAVRWYLRAAELGFAPAQRNLGGMYGSGRGVPQNDTLARRWFLAAANQGDAQAQYVLGKHYSANSGDAISWLWKAAEQGHAEAIAEITRRLDV